MAPVTTERLTKLLFWSEKAGTDMNESLVLPGSSLYVFQKPEWEVYESMISSTSALALFFCTQSVVYQIWQLECVSIHARTGRILKYGQFHVDSFSLIPFYAFSFIPTAFAPVITMVGKHKNTTCIERTRHQQ